MSYLVNPYMVVASAEGITEAFASAGYDGSYNNDTSEFDGSVWASNGNTTYSAKGLYGSANNGNATAFMAGGWSGSSVLDTTSNYNGSAWSDSGTLPNPTQEANQGAGDNTDGLSAGGKNGGASQTWSQSYDGSTWTVENGLPSARRMGGMGGTASSAIYITSYYNQGISSIWDGTSWSNITNNPLSVYAGIAGAEDSDNAIYNWNTTTNSWNGSAWASETASGIDCRTGGGGGHSTAFLIFGGYSQDESETYNGTSWTTQGDVSYTSSDGASGGAQVS